MSTYGKMRVGAKNEWIEVVELINATYVRIKCLKCGTQKPIRRANFTSTKSCGCMRRKLQADGKRTHGQSKGTNRTPEYTTWQNMIARCDNSHPHRNRSYIGIQVCERWRNSFESFLTDMGQRPSPNHSIERKNSKLGYNPNNCVWATKVEQARNRPDWCYSVTWNNETHQLHEWAAITGVPAEVIRNRLWRKWSVDRALTHPYRPKKS